jgi:hypothetical protein
MIAKRYTGLLLDTLPHDAPNQDTEYVLASDYDRMLALGETYERDCKRLLVVGTRQKAYIAQLEAALRRLRNEAQALHAFEHEVRAAIGNTNWECLMLRVREADSFVYPTAETTGDAT